MAQRPARAPNTALLGDDGMSADESALMDANRESESIQPEAEPEAPETVETPQPELALEVEEHEEPAIDPKTGQQRKVDYGALHAERQKRKAAEAEVGKAREEAAKLMGRFETIQQAIARSQQPQPEAPAEIPDINLDPVGHFQAKFAQAEKQLQDVNRWRESQEANSTAMNNVAQLQRIAQQHEADFSKTTPDYQDAFQYVRAQRDQELQDMGYADPGVRQQIIQNDALQIAAQALQGNKNAAEVVYKIAKARGYAGKAAATAPVVKSPDLQKLTNIAKGQAANTSLGQVGGTSLPEMTAESIAKMPDAEFEKWLSTNEDTFRKMMGG